MMFVGKHYLPVIKALKNGDRPLIAHDDERAHMVANRIVSLGYATCESVEMETAGTVYYLKPVHSKQPKQAVIEAQTKVQVSWWRDGERKGLFSQQAYKVLARDDRFVTISLMGKAHKVSVAQVRVA